MQWAVPEVTYKYVLHVVVALHRTKQLRTLVETHKIVLRVVRRNAGVDSQRFESRWWDFPSIQKALLVQTWNAQPVSLNWQWIVDGRWNISESKEKEVQLSWSKPGVSKVGPGGPVSCRFCIFLCFLAHLIPINGCHHLVTEVSTRLSMTVTCIGVEASPLI